MADEIKETLSAPKAEEKKPFGLGDLKTMTSKFGGAQKALGFSSQKKEEPKFQSFEEFTPAELEAHKQPLDIDIATKHNQRFVPDVDKTLTLEKGDGVGNYIAKHAPVLTANQHLMDAVIDVAGEEDIPLGGNMQEAAAKWLYTHSDKLPEVKQRYENALKRAIYLKR